MREQLVDIFKAKYTYQQGIRLLKLIKSSDRRPSGLVGTIPIIFINYNISRGQRVNKASEGIALLKQRYRLVLRLRYSRYLVVLVNSRLLSIYNITFYVYIRRYRRQAEGIDIILSAREKRGQGIKSIGIITYLNIEINIKVTVYN